MTDSMVEDARQLVPAAVVRIAEVELAAADIAEVLVEAVADSIEEVIAAQVAEDSVVAAVVATLGAVDQWEAAVDVIKRRTFNCQFQNGQKFN